MIWGSTEMKTGVLIFLLLGLAGCATGPSFEDYYLLCNGQVAEYTGAGRISPERVVCK